MTADERPQVATAISELRASFFRFHGSLENADGD
jgi:hypothetical protein